MIGAVMAVQACDRAKYFVIGALSRIVGAIFRVMLRRST